MFGRRGGGGGRQVCQFFLEGRCRFGDNCKNEHPTGQGSSQGGGGGFGNRFDALDNRNRSSGTPNQDSNLYNVNGETIKLDLTTERPIWPLSAYGPGKNAPRQLIEGDVEQSPEEMRVRHYLAVAKGNPQESTQIEAQTAAKANEVIQKILADINGAVKYIVDGKDTHPNRLDMANNGSNQQQPQQQNAFGAPTAAPAAPAASGFGQPSGLGQQTSTFGKPAFGQPAAQQQSAFGQPSTSGKPAQSGFGQPSAMGGGGSAFGQPSQPGQSSGFGAPSALGGSGGGTSAFGQPSAPGQSTGFGQPSQMGQKPAFGQSTFGQSSQPGFGKPAFGQASAPSAQQQSNASPFGAAASQPSAFGQAASQPSTGFGQPSAFGAAASKPSPFAAAAQNQQQQKPSPFGAPSQPSAFGQPSQPAAQQSPFSTGGASSTPKPNPFGGSPQPTAFGQPSQPAPASNPFGQSQAQQAAPAVQPNGTNESIPTGGPDPSSYLTLGPNNNATTFKQQPVTYLGEPKNYHVYQNRAANNAPEHLWFPSGPPAAKNKDIQLEDVYYTGELGKELQAIYETVAAQGIFAAGMPEVPPKREWIRYDM